MDYLQRLENSIPVIDVGLAVSLLGDIYGFNSPVYLPYGLQRDFAARGYRLPEEVVSGELGDYVIRGLNTEEDSRVFSRFGTPVLGSFTIKASSLYKKYDKKTGRLVDANVGDFVFPYATIVDFERPKNITKTPTVGSAGTVKEIFGFDDWRINIRGICLDDGSRNAQKTAEEQQLYLIMLNEIAGSLAIDDNNTLFGKKGIYQMTFERLSFSASQGKPGIIQFEIEAYSDEDILLTDVL